jgi:hypothetical protein
LLRAILGRYLLRLLEKVVNFDHLLLARYSASILVMDKYLAVLPALSMFVALLEAITGFPSRSCVLCFALIGL